MKRILITGSSGRVGHYLLHHFSGRYDVTGTYLNNNRSFKNCATRKLDLLEKDLIYRLFRDVKPDFVINTVGLSDVDKCEENHELAYNVNVLTARHLCEIGSDFKSKIVHISTDSVFDGERSNYNEENPTSPVNEYSRTKLEGEAGILKNNKNLVIRCSVYGWTPSRNSKKTLPESIYLNLKEGKEINLFADHVLTPVYAGTLSSYIEKMLDSCSGIFNVGIAEPVNKYEIGLMVADIFRMDKHLIKKASSSEARFLAKRPKNLSLDVSKLKNTIGALNVDLKSDILNMQKDMFLWS